MLKAGETNMWSNMFHNMLANMPMTRQEIFYNVAGTMLATLIILLWIKLGRRILG
jgi:hypothetical protein